MADLFTGPRASKLVVVGSKPPVWVPRELTEWLSRLPGEEAGTDGASLATPRIDESRHRLLGREAQWAVTVGDGAALRELAEWMPRASSCPSSSRATPTAANRAKPSGRSETCNRQAAATSGGEGCVIGTAEQDAGERRSLAGSVATTRTRRGGPVRAGSAHSQRCRVSRCLSGGELSRASWGAARATERFAATCVGRLHGGSGAADRRSALSVA